MTITEVPCQAGEESSHMEAKRGMSLLTLIKASSGMTFTVNMTTSPLARVRDRVSTNPVDNNEGMVGDGREMLRVAHDDISMSVMEKLQ